MKNDEIFNVVFKGVELVGTVGEDDKPPTLTTEDGTEYEIKDYEKGNVDSFFKAVAKILVDEGLVTDEGRR